MRKKIDVSAEEYSEIVDSFYAYFENGYKFEEFLKVYLEKIGLEEVFVTKKSGDGGIDLTAVRKGIVDQVQNCLLEWTIRLESEGVLGEGMRFSQEETAMAQKVPQTINNYYGTVVNGNIKRSQVVSGDHNSLSFNYEQASDLIRQIKKAIQDEQMSEEDREIAEELISESESKIAAQAKPGVIRATLSGLKDFLIGAGANIAGALIVQYLQ